MAIPQALASHFLAKPMAHLARYFDSRSFFSFLAVVTMATESSIRDYAILLLAIAFRTPYCIVE
jgi:hypothetical protein